MTSVGQPAASQIAATRCVVVVFPAVPVTPTTRNAREGWPWNASASNAMSRRASSLTTCGTASGSGRSTSSADAPRPTASAANSWPSLLAPTRQQNRAPLEHARES